MLDISFDKQPSEAVDFFDLPRPDNPGELAMAEKITSDQFLSSALIAQGPRALAYRKREGTDPTLLFLPGYASDMDGAKALAVDAFAAEQGIRCVRFDYSGTGSSPGRFEDSSLATWIEDAAAVVGQLVPGPVVVIGSSMGAWIALHLALRFPGQVVGLVGIAAAPDFTDWGFSDDQRHTLERDGSYQRPGTQAGDGQLTTLRFWRSGQSLRLLGSPINIRCPVRLIHGDADDSVPVAVAHRLQEQLRSSDVQLTLLQGGGHRLSEPHEIAAILDILAALLETVR